MLTYKFSHVTVERCDTNNTFETATATTITTTATVAIVIAKVVQQNGQERAAKTWSPQ